MPTARGERHPAALPFTGNEHEGHRQAPITRLYPADVQLQVSHRRPHLAVAHGTCLPGSIHVTAQRLHQFLNLRSQRQGGPAERLERDGAPER
jgi:hypothetical protein